MKRYDLAFSLGRACSCSETLRKAGMQYLSFPWDWIGAERALKPDLQLRTDSICDGSFHSWFTPDDLELVAEYEWYSKIHYRSRSTGLLYNHDFAKGVPLEESFPAVKAKYDRRMARLMDLIGRSKSILLVRIDPPNGLRPTSVEDCIAARKRFAERFPHARFDFVMMSFEKGRPFAERRTEEVEEGFLHVSFDYKDYAPGKPDYAVVLDQTAAILKEVATVQDYRTKAEVAAFRARTRRAKMEQVGAKNAWEYFLIRRKRDLQRLASAISPRILLARMRARKFDHVFSLGVNCEPAFRFFCKWGFVDSTPFAWTQTFDIARLTRALRHPEETGADGFEWKPRALMWQCRRTGLCFHGKMKVSFGQPPPDEEAMKADREDLAGRLAHLQKKLASACADNSKKVFVYRVNSSEVLAGGIGEKLDDLQRALHELGAKDSLLLVVAERAVARRIPPAPGRVVRSVKAFNPCNRVAVRTMGDPVGWDAVFTEFAPAVVKKATHKFKFE